MFQPRSTRVDGRLAKVVCLAALTACAHAGERVATSSEVPPSTTMPEPARVGKHYSAHDPTRLLGRRDGPEGREAFVDLRYLDAVIDDLGVVLSDYPPAFATPGDRDQAVADVRMFAGALEALLSSPPQPVELLWRAGRLHALGHQLDLAGEAELAARRFAEALSLDPNLMTGNYFFGVFLAGTGSARQAIPYLEKARAAGLPQADRDLGLAYVVLQDRERAMTHLRRYLKLRPEDLGTLRLLRALERGEPIRTERIGG